MQNTNETGNGMTKGLFGETDRESGEYHFRNGYTQQVYSNAHFVPVEESTSTPKYYRPAEKASDRSGDRTAAGRRVQQKKAKTQTSLFLTPGVLTTSFVEFAPYFPQTWGYLPPF